MFLKIRLSLFTYLIGITLSFGQSEPQLLLYSDAIYFASGSDKVAPKYFKILDGIATAINSDAKATAWIQAHTDSLGSYESNEELSDRRARAIYEELAHRKVDSAKLKIDSHGEYVPMSSNGTAKGRALNRRVTIEVVKPYKKTIRTEHRCVLKGKVLDAHSKEPVPTKLIFNSLAGKDSLETDSEGNYEYVINIETNVEIRAYAKGYFFLAKLGKTLLDETVEVDFQLEAAVLGGKMALSDLFFQGGTPLLLPSSEKALDGVVAFMAYNSELKIEIGGHINKPNQAPVPESSSSFRLSESRAKVVYNYLISKGISKDRLSFKGYGNSEMIHPRADTPIQEQMNRRVEMKVIE